MHSFVRKGCVRHLLYLLSPISYLLSPICVAHGATLDNLCNRIGFGVEEITDSGCTLTNGIDTLRFFSGGRRFELNRRSFWLNAPAMADSRGGFTFEYVDMVNLIAPLFAAQVSTNRPLRVQLDAGHGGEDSGCISPHGGLYEKDLVLDITLRAGEFLAARGIEVIYSRTNDTFVSLAGRSGIAAKHKADAFVAVHANYAENQTARGIETFTLPFAKMSSTTAESSVSTIARIGNAHDYSNTVLGYEIQRRMPGRLGEADRGLRHARFQVLRDTPCPAVLIEIGFLSNPTDSRNLSSNWYRDRIALAIADGVSAFSDRRRTAAVREKSKVESPKSKVEKPAQPLNSSTNLSGSVLSATNAVPNRQTVKPSNCQTNAPLRDTNAPLNRLTAQPLNSSTNLSISASSATNAPLNRSTAQPFNPSTNLSGSASSAPRRETNAVPNRQTVKPSNCQTNAPLRATNAPLNRLTSQPLNLSTNLSGSAPSAPLRETSNAVSTVTNAPPTVTNAPPVATNALPSVTNALPSVTNAPSVSSSMLEVESRKPKAIEDRRELPNAVDYLLSPIPYLLSPISNYPCSPLS